MQPDSEEQCKEFHILMREYTAIKDEQVKRIGMRDQTQFVALGVVGAVFTFAFEGNEHLHALLIVPWAAAILGWSYLANDDSVTRIGKYFRGPYETRLRKVAPLTEERPLGWEYHHRADPLRKPRKYVQLLVDLVSFVGPSILAIVIYLVRGPQPDWLIWTIVGLDIALSVALTACFCIFHDAARAEPLE
jgi:hypothetical protein